MVTRVRFEYRLANGLRHRVIAAPSVRPVAAFERQDAAGKWHQEPLQDVRPTLLMTLGRMLAEHDNPGVTVTVDGDTMDIGLGELDAADPTEECRDAVDQQRALDAMRPAQRAELDAMARGEIVPCGPIPDPERRCACHQEAGDSLCEVHPPALGAPYTKPCTNYSPAGFTGHWREWHRGHGCDKDDGKPRTGGGR